MHITGILILVFIIIGLTIGIKWYRRESLVDTALSTQQDLKTLIKVKEINVENDHLTAELAKGINTNETKGEENE